MEHCLIYHRVFSQGSIHDGSVLFYSPVATVTRKYIKVMGELGKLQTSWDSIDKGFVIDHVAYNFQYQ
jgi:hypothetical protein